MRVGCIFRRRGYLAEVRDICREHDILFVVDEVVTGFGRIGGEWFASTRFDLQPDMMTTAKGLTSGYVPMGAVFIAPRVAEPFYAGSWWRHGYTYGGHAGAAAAAMANLDILERENLLAESKRLERRCIRICSRWRSIRGWRRFVVGSVRSRQCSWLIRRRRCRS